jgi:integrase/recombinase XerD
VVPLDFPTVQAFDTYEFERMRVTQAAAGDHVLVNLFRAPIGAPLRPDAVGELLAAASRRAGLDPPIRPHQLRHACGSNLEMSGVAADASFDKISERFLPATSSFVADHGLGS